MSDDQQPGAGPSNLSAQFAASTEDVADMYDGWADSYDDDLDGWDYTVPDRLAARLAAAGLLDGEVLDAGCGTGRSGVALREAGATNVLGADLSPASLLVAERRGVYRSTMAVDLKQPLPFVDDRFIAAMSAGVFSYVGDPEPVLRELLRVVRAGGVVTFSQRTDLWPMYDCDAVIARLVDEGVCTADVSGPLPYLPLHPEFGDEIGVIETTLTVA
ncbi:MAG: class I SAM-dependent methyltransferase [Ilumatobacter sp.]|nr:class I SAM-dependent methyltransferase [Ilumatobacter sp.]